MPALTKDSPNEWRATIDTHATARIDIDIHGHPLEFYGSELWDSNPRHTSVRAEIVAVQPASLPRGRGRRGGHAGGDMAPLARNETLMQECCAAVATASCIDILGVSATFVEAIGACGAFRLRTGNLP
jgi:hypothetical protein